MQYFRNNPGSLNLFKLFGIQVSAHWSWMIVATILIYFRGSGPDGVGYLMSAAIILSLFGIVLMHEFGHALACKSVGGKADQITLWPLGGVAFVQPPQRPWPVLWSIVAGPLVNLVLIVPLAALLIASLFITGSLEQFANTNANAATAIGSLDYLSEYLFILNAMNIMLFIFNMIPAYPLDGGQILNALLWMKLGRGKALITSGWIGVGFAGLMGAGAFMVFNSIWIAAVALFIGMQAWQGIKVGQMLLAYEKQEQMHRDAADRFKQASQIFWNRYGGTQPGPSSTDHSSSSSNQPSQTWTVVDSSSTIDQSAPDR